MCAEDEAILEMIGMLLHGLCPGDRLVVGLDEDGQAFACIDMAPPVDRGPLEEASTPMRALLLLGHRILHHPEGNE